MKDFLRPRATLGLPVSSLLDGAASDCSRRSFLGFSVSAASTILFGCSGSSKHPSGKTADGGVPDAGLGDGGTDAAPFGIWEKLRTAVRASPDHLGAAADRLVLAKDPQAIFEFVRDNIVGYPTGLDGAVTETRWGARGTLRGGAGTPREKVELLAELYRRAGFDATVVSGAVDDNPQNVAVRAYLRPVIRTFAPDVDAATIAAWTAEMSKVADVPISAPIDADDTERTALVQAISALIPGDASAMLGSYDATLGTAGIGEVPLVAVTVAGETRYANPHFAEARFGDSLTIDTPVPAVPATLAPMVVVELSISTTTAPTTRVSVVKATYSADMLAGRQIMAQFAPAMSMGALASRPIADIHSFKPVLSLRGHDVDPDSDPSFVVVGPQMTTRGDIVDTSADGTVTVNGRRLFAASEVNTKAALSVASVAMEIRAGAFPTVRLVVSVLDAASKPVKGLPASAFQVTEGGADVGMLLSATPNDNVRVCLVFDIDDPLGTGEDPLEFARQLTVAVIAAYPGAVILTGTGGVYVEQSDPAAVAAAVAGGDSDDTWSDLADAALQAPTLIVVVSDFLGLTDPTDPSSYPKGAYRAIVAAGPPVVAISTDPPPAPSHPVVEGLAILTAGVSVPSGGIASSVQAVLDLLRKQKAGGTYSLTYRAPIAGPAKRDVQVMVNQISATGSYTAPTASKIVEQSALAGLYLTVSLGDNTITRVLGGYRHPNPPDPGVEVAQSVRDEVTNALFGVSLLSFEAASPSPSTSLDDLLSIKLAIQPLSDAVAAKDSTAIRGALPTLRTFVPAELTALQCAPAPSTVTSTTYEDGLRVVHYSHQPRLGVGDLKRVDILPLSGWGTVSADAKKSFQDTLARTARVAVVEGHTFPKSTLSELAGKTLTLLPIGGVDPATLPYAPEVLTPALEVLAGYDEYYRLLPAGVAFVGFWAVNPRTGTLIGVLPDGTGGASQSGECTQANATSDAFTVLGILAGLAGMGALGPLFFLGQKVAEIALLSAAILDGQDGMIPSDPDAAINGLAASAACAAKKLALTSVAPAAGNAVDRLIAAYDRANSLVSLSHISGASFNCPNALAGVGCK
jgi:hypothetical protein